MKNRIKIPATLALGTGVNGLASYLTAIQNDVAKNITAHTDRILDTGALLQLMSIALTAGSLVLAVWGMIKAQQTAIIAALVNAPPTTAPLEHKSILSAIDDFLSASIEWFLSFSAFVIAYFLILALDDLVDITTNTVANGFTIPGFVDFVAVVGEATAAPALFLVGMVLLVSGTWKTILALHRLAPHLRSNETLK